MSWMEVTAAGVLGIIAVTGAWLDVRFRRLPNWLCAIGLATGLASGFAMEGGSWAGMSALHALVALVIGMGVFAMGAVGGGDAKYYAALAAWFPLGKAALLLGAVSVAGLLLLVAWLPLRRRVASSNRVSAQDDAFRKLPYGVAISAGAIVAFPIQSFPG